jgi:hypothetical protein
MGKYRAKPGSPFTDEDATVIGPVIDALAQESPGGVLKPEMVVESARNHNSPIHKYFEWEDTEAARKWRTHQARMMIGSVIITVKTERREPVRAFYNIVSEENERGYVTHASVMSNEEYRRQIVQNAMRELESWAKKYRTYDELKPIAETLFGFVEANQ